LIHLGIDLETFGRHPETRDATRAAWGIGPDDMVIGTASAMKPVKRIEDFIRVVADVARTDRRVVGVIAGRVPKGYEEYHETLRREANATGLAARFRWVGHLEPIEPFHHACDVFVSTSECETFGNSVCEAMACSRPVLAYEGGSVQEVVASTGRIVPTGDLAGLKASLRELLDDPAMRRRMGESARNRVAEHFQPKSSLEKLTRVYRSLLGEGDNRTPRGAHAIRSLHSKCDN
jgi:glycosyltransferase involved in cell wall biosynthesis